MSELNWLRPVRPGDALHVAVEIQEISESESEPGRDVIRFLTATMAGDGQTVATMIGTVLVPRRPPA